MLPKLLSSSESCAAGASRFCAAQDALLAIYLYKLLRSVVYKLLHPARLMVGLSMMQEESTAPSPPCFFVVRKVLFPSLRVVLFCLLKCC